MDKTHPKVASLSKRFLDTTEIACDEDSYRVLSYISVHSAKSSENEILAYYMTVGLPMNMVRLDAILEELMSLGIIQKGTLSPFIFTTPFCKLMAENIEAYHLDHLKNRQFKTAA